MRGGNPDPALHRDWTLFTIHNLLFMFGFTVYTSVFVNFLRDILHAGPLLLGQLESLREIPGLLAALTAGTLAAFAEIRLAWLGTLITAAGITLTGFVYHQHSLIAVTVFWSIGFHAWTSVTPAITIALAKGLEGGRHLGRMSAIGAGGQLGGLVLATSIALVAPHLSYRAYFLIAGVFIVAAAGAAMGVRHHGSRETRSRLVFRREYGLYYVLTFLEGCRRQIFSIFATFALVLVYRVPLRDMLVLQLVNAVMISITAPFIGRVIDLRGEKGSLTAYSAGLILVFLGYATFQSANALKGLYLIDNVLFSFGIGYTTYLHRIVRPRELTPCLAMGVTMNHVAAVTVPIGGALLWERTQNYQAPFWVGVGLACIALVANRFLPAGPKPVADQNS